MMYTSNSVGYVVSNPNTLEYVVSNSGSYFSHVPNYNMSFSMVERGYSGTNHVTKNYAGINQIGLDKITQDYELPKQKEQEIIVGSGFLDPNRNLTFIDDAKEIKEYVEETFRLVTGTELPNHLIIELLDEDKFDQIHHGGKGVVGFCTGNEIFIKKGDLAQVLVTCGHEIGHAISRKLNGVNEEAKAFAFEWAWVQKIREFNVAGLKNCFTNEVAKNGLHDVAFDFVRRKVVWGKDPFDLFKELIDGMCSVEYS